MVKKDPKVMLAKMVPPVPLVPPAMLVPKDLKVPLDQKVRRVLLEFQVTMDKMVPPGL